MEILVFAWALTVGYVPEQSNQVFSQSVSLDESRIATVTDIELSVMAWDRLMVSTDIETYQYYSSDKLGFNPYRADYSISADFFVSDNLLFGVSHECDHPVASSYKRGMIVSDYQYGSVETTLYVKIGSKLK